ncbi:MAG: YaeQ family protein [Gammaproteobacteria bacterium]|nr:YaeQ family protein [Gammaproteobacteria bacterium]
MALKATIFKARLNIADMDRQYYAEHNLTIARHPSETDIRMMVRLAAFAFNAEEFLEFGKGLSDDEPALWAKDLTGEVQTWIELGQPDERDIRRACGRARKVVVYCYSGNSAGIWWQGIMNKLHGLSNLSVYELDPEAVQALADAVERSMDVQVSIQDGEALFSVDDASITLVPKRLL